MSSWSDLSSDKALVCNSEHRNKEGVATVWSVLLSDGYLLDCGSDKAAKARAHILATIINESGPEKLSRAALGAANTPEQQT